MGARRVAQRLGALHRHRDRRGDRGDACAQSLEQRFRYAGWRLPTSPAGSLPGQATGRSFWVATARSISRPRSPATPLSNRVGAGLDPCGALQTRLELERERHEPRSSFFLGETAADGGSPIVAQEISNRRSRCRPRRRVAALWDDTARRRPGDDAGSFHGHSAEPLAALSDPCPAASGRVRPFIRRAALTAFVTSFRT